MSVPFSQEKKKKIDDALVRYDERMFALRQRRQSAITNFVSRLDDKRIAIIRRELGLS